MEAVKLAEESAKKFPGLSRRSFLKSTAAATGAAAAVTALGCAPKAEEETSGTTDAAQPNYEAKTYTANCRGNCGGRCVIEANVRDGKVVRTRPRTFDRSYEGFEQGCVRAPANPVRLYGQARLRYPMKRVEGTERGAGQWERISWDEAIQLMAEKFTAAINEYGGSSICIQNGGNNASLLDSSPFTMDNRSFIFYAGVGVRRLTCKIGATVLGTAGDQAGDYFGYYLLNIPSNSPEDMVNSKTIICWGANPAEAGVNRAVWNMLMNGRDAGAQLITVDPLYTPTAAQSDQWLPVRCGSDTAIMLAIVNYIEKNGLANTEYLKNGSIAPFLVKADEKYLRTSDLGLAEAGSDADEPVVFDNATQSFVSFRDAQDPAIHGSFTADGIAVRTIYDVVLENIADVDIALAAKESGLTEEKIEWFAKTIATEGPVFFYMHFGVEHTYNSWRIYFALALLAAVTGNVGIPGGQYGLPGFPAATMFKIPVTTDMSVMQIEDAKPNKIITGDYLVDIMRTGKWAGEDLPVRVLLVQSCDPLDNFAGPNDLIEAYSKIDFVVTMELFMTTTAHYSDLVLPCAMPWEAEDFVTFGTTAMMTQKAVEPVAEARPDYDIFVDLANAMGYTDLFPNTREEVLRGILDTPENIEAGVGYDDYKEHGAINGEYVPGVSVGQEMNPWGRTRFYLEYLPPRDDYGQYVEFRDRMPRWQENIEAYLDNPDRAKYPLNGFSGHNNYWGQSMWGKNPFLDEFRTINGKPFCRIHEDAAAERGIKTGDRVKVYNDHGFVVLNALVTRGIQKDSVWLPHGFYWDEFDEGYAQSLTGYYMDPATSNANFNDWICQVEKY